MLGTDHAGLRGGTAGLMFGAALLAFAGVASPARGQEQTAATVPRLQGGQVGLPSVLAAADALAYRRIFSAQAQGRFAQADADLALLNDRLLVGHVLADRLLGPHWRARPDELSAWLAAYADHPDAPRIHRLLRARSPRSAAMPPEPEEPVVPSLDLSSEELPPPRPFMRNPALDRAIRAQLRNDNPAAALAVLRAQRGLEAAYAGSLAGEIALALFLRNRDSEALAVVRDFARDTGGDVADLAWAGGLAAWRLGRFDEARRLFERAARAPIGSAARRAAAAFWAGRTALRLRDHRAYVPWLLEAAQSTRSFYGLLARRALGLPSGFAWERELIGESDVAVLAETAQGLRALALLQIGQIERAEGELRRLAAAAAENAALARAVLVVASQSGMAELAMRIAPMVESRDGRPRDYALFPLPAWRPDETAVDPALVLAIARVESNFDAAAVSPAGARGVLQLMPLTASYVAGRPELAGRARHRLHDLELNLELGSRYIAYLARRPEVDGDLLRLLVAYNAGPGSLVRMTQSMIYGNDPLLFLEAIPVHETRVYAQRVLAFAWIYASRLRRPAPSLDALASGRFPRYGPEEQMTAGGGLGGERLATRRSVN